MEEGRGENNKERETAFKNELRKNQKSWEKKRIPKKKEKAPSVAKTSKKTLSLEKQVKGIRCKRRNSTNSPWTKRMGKTK